MVAEKNLLFQGPMFRFHFKLWLFQCRKSIHETETYNVTRSFLEALQSSAIETFTIKNPHIPCKHLIEHGFARIMSWVQNSLVPVGMIKTHITGLMIKIL